MTDAQMHAEISSRSRSQNPVRALALVIVLVSLQEVLHAQAIPAGPHLPKIKLTLPNTAFPKPLRARCRMSRESG
jgi:hypothetical protein